MTGPIWHYTCNHRAPMIRADGVVKPHPQPLLAGLKLSWWSDLGTEHRYELGLTSNMLRCDRMEARFEAKEPLVWWPRYARGFPVVIRNVLEDGRLPAHWWIALEPIEVTW